MNDLTFSALAEPTRLKILELLRQRPYSVNDIALVLHIRQPQASKHLHVLADAGLVSMRPHAQQRIYSINSEPFLQLEDWANSFQRYWDERLNSLEKHLKKG